MPEGIPFHDDRVIVAHMPIDGLFLVHPTQQCRSALVHESLRQPIVKGVGQPVLDRAGPFLPMPRVGQPFTAIRDVRPRSDMGDPCGERIDVPIGPVEAGDVISDPIRRKAHPRAT